MTTPTALSNVNTNELLPEQLDLVKRTIAKGATTDELKLFLYRCKSLGLDPLKPGQIYFIKYGNGPGTIVVGIEGFRAKAARTGQLSGIERGVLRDDKGNCIGGWAKVYRKDWQHPASEEVSLSEYDTGRGSWAKMKETMIKKVAEAAALRMAFPDDLGGVYVKEEMDQAESPVRPDQPGDEDGTPYEQDYRIPFGKYARRSIPEVVRTEGPDKLASYIDFLESSSAKSGKQFTPQVKEFVDRASKYLADLENGNVDPKENEQEQPPIDWEGAPV